MKRKLFIAFVIILIFTAGRAANVAANKDEPRREAEDVPQSLDLKQGFNLIGISKTVEPLTFGALMADNHSFRGIYKFNTAAGSFIQIARNASDLSFRRAPLNLPTLRYTSRKFKLA